MVLHLLRTDECIFSNALRPLKGTMKGQTKPFKSLHFWEKKSGFNV